MGRLNCKLLTTPGFILKVLMLAVAIAIIILMEISWESAFAEPERNDKNGNKQNLPDDGEHEDDLKIDEPGTSGDKAQGDDREEQNGSIYDYGDESVNDESAKRNSTKRRKRASHERRDDKGRGHETTSEEAIVVTSLKGALQQTLSATPEPLNSNDEGAKVVKTSSGLQKFRNTTILVTGIKSFGPMTKTEVKNTTPLSIGPPKFTKGYPRRRIRTRPTTSKIPLEFERKQKVSDFPAADSKTHEMSVGNLTVSRSKSSRRPSTPAPKTPARRRGMNNRPLGGQDDDDGTGEDMKDPGSEGDAPAWWSRSSPSDDDDEYFALIYGVSHDTYVMLHASVYTYIPILLSVLVTYLVNDAHPPYEMSLTFIGAFLHFASANFMILSLKNDQLSVMKYALTITVIVLLFVICLLMMIDTFYSHMQTKLMSNTPSVASINTQTR